MKTQQSIYLHNISGTQQIKIAENISFLSAVYDESNGFYVNCEFDETDQKKEACFLVSDSHKIPDNYIFVGSADTGRKLKYIYQQNPGL